MRIFVINTGGTIGMVGKPLKPAKSAKQLLQGIRIPRGVQLTLHDFELRQDSTNIWNADRIQMAKEIAAAYNDHDAILVLHGTDSLDVTCSIFNLIFKLSLQKAMAVVGTQFTKNESGSEVKMQIENSLRVLEAFFSTDIVGIYNVTIGDVWDGSRLVKRSESDILAFHTPGRSPVAKCRPTLMFSEGLRRKDKVLEVQGLRLDTAFEIQLHEGIKVSADIDPRGLTVWVDAGIYSGIILEAKGSGNIPDRIWPGTDPPMSWVTAIEYATQKGIHIGIISPFEDGRVILERYELGQKAKDAGALSLESLTEPMGQAKFRQAIAMYPNDPARIQHYLSTNIIGELLGGMEYAG